jgi:osmoprotectant transport system substrate-binding protein
MRLHRKAAAVVAAAMIAAGCGSGGSSSGTTVASRLVLGGPPECQTRITCLVGLQQIYGLHFKSFQALDIGPLTESALGSGQIQVARLDSSDYAIQQHHWVILQDDKHFQQAGNIIPVVRTSKVTPEVTSLLNSVSSAMTQDDLFTLNREVGLDHMDPGDAAKKFVADKALAQTPTAGTKESLTIGSFAFSESVVLANIYFDVLKNAGYSVNLKTKLGNREVTQPALVSGQIDVLPEYAGNYLTFLDSSIGSLSLDQTVARLRSLAGAKGLTVLEPSNATDSDSIVVTGATANKYHLTTISDMAKKV